jgi:hypothetical protein
MEPTLRALTGKAEIRAAFERLRARLREGAQAFERSVGYQGGADRFTVYWRQAMRRLAPTHARRPRAPADRQCSPRG